MSRTTAPEARRSIRPNITSDEKGCGRGGVRAGEDEEQCEVGTEVMQEVMPNEENVEEHGGQ